MKKLLALIISIVILLSMVPFQVMAEDTTPTVIYVDGSATGGDGSTVSGAVATISDAYDLLGNEGGTIVICGDVTITDTYTFPSRNGKVIITGCYNGVDYEPTITLAGSSKMYLHCTSEIEFNNIHINRTNTGGCVEFFSGPSLAFGENMRFTYNGNPIDENTDGRIAVRMGNYSSDADIAQFTMRSGTISYIQGGNNKQNVGISTINFGGTAAVTVYMQGGGVNKSVTSSTINITGGNIPVLYANGYGSATLANSFINISGGTVATLLDARANATGQLTGSVSMTLLGNSSCVGDINLDAVGIVTGEKNLTFASGLQENVDLDLSKWDNVAINNTSTIDLVSSYQAPSTSLVVESGSKLILHNDTTLPSSPAVISGEISLYSEAADVVYISGQGNDANDGLSPSTAVATFDAAGALLQNTGGTIIVCDDVSINSSYAFPVSEERITITSKYDGTDYNAVIILAGTSKLYMEFNSEYEFNNIKINKTNSGGGSEIFTGPMLTFGENVELQVNGGAVGSNNIGVRLGHKNKDCEAAAFIMNSGTVSYILGGNNFYSVNASTITVGGTATIVDHIQGGGTEKNVGTSTITITGGNISALYINGYGEANLVSSTIHISGGVIDRIATQRTTGGIVTGNVEIQFTDVAVADIELSSDSIQGSKTLIYNSVDSCVCDEGFDGWSEVKLLNGSTVYLYSVYHSPESLQIDSTSELVLNQKHNEDIPIFSGEGTVRIGPMPYSGKTYDEYLLLTTTTGSQATGSVQGTAAYGDYLLVFYHQGSCDIFDLSSSTPSVPIGSFRLASYNPGTAPDGSANNAYSNHANQAMFGSVKFADTDPLPLVYVLDGNSGSQDENGYIARCAVERIVCNDGVWSSQLVQTIIYNDLEYAAPYDSATGKFTYLDNAEKQFVNTNGYERFGWGWPAFFVDSVPTSDTQDKLYIFSARFRTTTQWEATNKTQYGIDSYFEDNAYIITEFDLPELPETEDDFGSAVTLYPTDIRDQFCTDYDVYATQGGTMYMGKIYYSFGFGGTAVGVKDAIRVYDIAERRIVGRIDLSDSVFYAQEPECCFVYDGKLGLSLIDRRMYMFNYIESVEYEEPPTCTDSGERYTKCCLCGERIQSIVLDALGHDIQDGTCTRCGGI